MAERTIAFAETFVAQQRFLDAAHRYCEARDHAEQLRKQVADCEFTHNTYCSRAMKRCPSGDPESDGIPVPESEWCEPCRNGIEVFRALGHARRRIGGFASAMFKAYRLTQPSPSLAQTPHPVASAGELTGREELAAGERERAEARAGSLRSRCEDSGREANGDSSSS